MRIVMKAAMVTKTEREVESELAPFDQNLLIPSICLGSGKLVIKLVSRLLTEGLPARI